MKLSSIWSNIMRRSSVWLKGFHWTNVSWIFNVGFSLFTSKKLSIMLRRALLRYPLPITSKLTVSADTFLLHVWLNKTNDKDTLTQLSSAFTNIVLITAFSCTNWSINYAMFYGKCYRIFYIKFRSKFCTSKNDIWLHVI